MVVLVGSDVHQRKDRRTVPDLRQGSGIPRRDVGDLRSDLRQALSRSPIYSRGERNGKGENTMPGMRKSDRENHNNRIPVLVQDLRQNDTGRFRAAGTMRETRSFSDPTAMMIIEAGSEIQDERDGITY